MTKALFTALLAATLLSTGCQTTQQARTSMRANEDRLLEQENQRRLTGRLETLEMEISRISRELDTLQTQLAARCAAIERKSEEDKRELVNRLSAQLEKLIKQATPAPAPASAAGGYGFEHTVRPGETLSTIAAAYGASVKKVIEVNQLKNPDRLSVGQTLFIPE